MKVSDYVPDLYKNNREMNNIINSEEIEFENNLKNNIEKLFRNRFLSTADEEGILEYEKFLNLNLGTSTENIEFRKKRIVNRLTGSIPFTERYMIAQLNKILGENNWSYELNYNNYTLVITSLIPRKIMV